MCIVLADRACVCVCVYQTMWCERGHACTRAANVSFYAVVFAVNVSALSAVAILGIVGISV